MKDYFLKLPFDLSGVVLGKPAATCSRQESIAQFIMLIVTSKYGDLPGSNDFGSEIWELEFQQLVNAHDWEQDVGSSIKRAIVNYEKRLRAVNVKVRLEEVEDMGMAIRSYGVRRQAKIYVNGIMKGTDKHFNFNTTIFVSPLSQ